MKKIRINELARELEVKPGVIIDMLPELGVQEKKTHSSSVDEDVALELRNRLLPHGQPAPGPIARAHDGPADRENGRHAGEEQAETRAASASPGTTTTVPAAPETREAARPQPLRPPLPNPVRPQLREHAPSIPLPPSAPRTAQPPASPVTTAETPAAKPVTPAAASSTPATSGATPGAPGATPAAPSGSATTPAQPESERPAVPSLRPPLRPPVGGGAGAIHPPLASPQTTPSTPGVANRNISIPARPLPPPRTGAPATGPRQPLPPEPPKAPASTPVFRPGTPAPPAEPAATPVRPPTPAAPRVQPPTHVIAPGAPASPAQPSASAVPGAPILSRPAAPRPGPGLTPGAPIAPRPAGARPPLAGQPQARPVVPPRQDILRRLQQQQAPARPTPSAPAIPRPGAPPARPSMPTPGQPQFRGPVRPGQPAMRGPGGPGQPGLRRPGGLRPMHPTALRPEVSTVPTEQQRRHAAKPGARQPGRKRDEDEGNLRERISKRTAVLEPPPIDREITVAEGITVKELSEKLGVKANLVIKKLVEKKIFATINQTLDVKLAEEIAREFGASTNQVSYEEESTQEVELAEDAKELVRRAPVVTIMGHVDHGKTSLLDAIRQTDVAGREAGGITQHIGAYHVEKNGRKIVFIDTPGHQAFTRMRARGAKVTDIVVLVVSADDGVMPQTLEAIDHARAASVPILVAINKIDKPDAQPDRVKQQLSDRGLLAEDWGGDVVMVPVSAKTGQNLDLLLEMILLVADIQDLKANPNRPATGTILEAKLDRGRGPVATMLVRNGTLRVGDFFICGALFNKVRAMFDDRGNPAKEAEPSMPVEVIGLEDLPEVGDNFQVVSDTSKAKQIVIYRESKARDAAMAKGARVASLASLNQQFAEGELKDLNLIIKADVGGTAEVLSDTLQQLSNEKVRVRVLRTGVGAITEDDVLLASASEAIIIGFNVRPERNAQSTAEQQKVDIRLHSIIYELIDEVQRAMTGLLEPVYKETIVGHAEVRETFRISKVGTVAGCYVSDGAIRRDAQIRVLRDGEVVHTGRIEALKRFKNDASEVKNGLECGISLVNYNNIQVGDRFEAFTMERIAPELPAPTAP
ncbi:MAG TPA: translation initiation factor IF-2 [Bryobacteraceae bacterium]|nr:translation initiation factor IF-2 [Bryobacteraceae bacterium]